jgi:integrase
MASLRRLPKSPFWIACFSLPDGSRTQRSTKSTDRREAQRIANQFEDAGKAGRQGRFIESQARKVIADIYALANTDQLPSSTAKDFFASWLKRKELEAGEKTHARYGIAVERFLEVLGSKATGQLTHVTHREIAAFRDHYAKCVSANTVNTCLKILRVAFNQAKRDGLIDVNPGDRVTLLKRHRNEVKRRPFTLDELARVLEVADDEWRGLIAFGIYTGQRLGDLAQLTWSNVDLQRRELRLVTDKTGRRQILPLAAPLARLIESLPTSDNPSAPLFPGAADTYAKSGHNGRMSKQFHAILVSAGLAKARKYVATGEGSSVRHEQAELSFHSLRHTATSLLKNAGVSDAVAAEFIGHDSAAVNANYTHIETAALRRAADTMPDVLNASAGESGGRNEEGGRI